MTVVQLHPSIPEGEDHHFEPAPGLPEALPESENLLWRGKPDRNQLAIRVFHVRKVAIYFGLLMAWSLIEAWHDGVPLAQQQSVIVSLLLIGSLACLILYSLGYLTAKHTVYTLTSERIVMAIGIALQIRLNLPFSKIEGVGLSTHKDGRGDIALTLNPEDKLSYAVLWPHARPWHFSRVQPTLRCVEKADQVAAQIAARIAASERASANAAATTESGVTEGATP